MSKIYTGASMSLDGYIAGPGESGFEHLFNWLGTGDVEVPTANPEMTLRMTETNAKAFRESQDPIGAIVVGRKLFDMTNAWGGTHPMGLPVVVVTHHEPDDYPRGNTPFTFVTTGIEDAIATASEQASGKNVGVNGGTIARQCLEAGLLDEIWVDLVPVILGGGTPFFDQLKNIPVVLDGPTKVTDGEGVTHLAYRVRR